METTTPSLFSTFTSRPTTIGENIEFDTNNSSWVWTAGRYFLIIIILGTFLGTFLGFNLFNYLGKVTGTISDLFRPILAFFGYGVGKSVTSTVNMSATGAKGLVDVTAGTINSGVNLLQQGLTGKSGIHNTEQIPLPDDSGSKTQQTKGKSKAGYCYIGEDRGFRSCIQVGEADMCMSGDIFPTHDICINPNLRN